MNNIPNNIINNKMFTLSTGESEFSDYVEKLHEKNYTWNKKWMVVDKNRIYFYEKKPGNNIH